MDVTPLFTVLEAIVVACVVGSTLEEGSMERPVPSATSLELDSVEVGLVLVLEFEFEFVLVLVLVFEFVFVFVFVFVLVLELELELELEFVFVFVFVFVLEFEFVLEELWLGFPFPIWKTEYAEFPPHISWAYPKQYVLQLELVWEEGLVFPQKHWL